MNTTSDNKPSPSRQASSGDSRLNDWTFKVLVDRRLTRKAVPVALFVRDSFDLHLGFSCPSFRMIASATGLSRGSAERATRSLVAKGHLALIPGGGGPGNGNIYKLTGGLN